MSLTSTVCVPTGALKEYSPLALVELPMRKAGMETTAPGKPSFVSASVTRPEMVWVCCWAWVWLWALSHNNTAKQSIVLFIVPFCCFVIGVTDGSRSDNWETQNLKAYESMCRLSYLRCCFDVRIIHKKM